MVQKQNVNDMSAEQLAAYVKAVREKRRQQSKTYYDNQIKGDPEKLYKEIFII